jgi:hypothetical protein
MFESIDGNRIAFRRRLSKIKLILGSSAACFKGSSRRIDRVIRSEVVATRFDHDGVFVEFIVALDHKINPVGRSRAAKVERILKPLFDNFNKYMKIAAKGVKRPEFKARSRRGSSRGESYGPIGTLFNRS